MRIVPRKSERFFVGVEVARGGARQHNLLRERAVALAALEDRQHRLDGLVLHREADHRPLVAEHAADGGHQIELVEFEVVRVQVEHREAAVLLQRDDLAVRVAPAAVAEELSAEGLVDAALRR